MDVDEAIELTEYDPDWKVHFEDEGIEVLEALGDSVREIEHIGSTAVEGMKSKPVVDIMVGVDTLEAISHRVVAMQGIGYEYLGEANVEGRLFFRKRGERNFNVSMVLYQGDHWQRNLALRDYLRGHPEAADRYVARKEEIVEEEGTDRLVAYSEAKSELVEELIDEALAWREGGG